MAEQYLDKMVVVKPESVKPQFKDLQFRLFMVEKIDGQSLHGKWINGCCRGVITLADIERLPRREDIQCLTQYEDTLF